MSDIQTMQQMVTGLKQKKINLEADEKVFLKLSGINEEIEKASQDKETYEDELAGAKEDRDISKKKKADSIAETTTKIEREMNKVLPAGRAVFSYIEDDDGKRQMKIGWKVDEKTTPYNGLSGGEKQIFDAALANVLDANIIVVEAAELDKENLFKILHQLAGIEKQVIVNTCHPINDHPAVFELIEV